MQNLKGKKRWPTKGNQYAASHLNWDPADWWKQWSTVERGKKKGGALLLNTSSWSKLKQGGHQSSAGEWNEDRTDTNKAVDPLNTELLVLRLTRIPTNVFLFDITLSPSLSFIVSVLSRSFSLPLPCWPSAGGSSRGSQVFPWLCYGLYLLEGHTLDLPEAPSDKL